MPWTQKQRSDLWTVFRLIAERDMPSNCTVERLAQRAKMPVKDVLWAVDVLWDEGTGFIQVDVNRHTGERGYYVERKDKKKTPNDLDALFLSWNSSLDDDDDEWEDDDDEDEDGDDEDEDMVED